VGEAVADRKPMDAAVADLAKITGQKPLICKSKKAIAAFKLREAWRCCKVTLRGARMYEFLDRLISRGDAAHPRLPRRLAARLRRRGNYTLGVREQIIFPEIQYTPSTKCAAWISPSRPRQRDNAQGVRC